MIPLLGPIHIICHRILGFVETLMIECMELVELLSLLNNVSLTQHNLDRRCWTIYSTGVSSCKCFFECLIDVLTLPLFFFCKGDLRR